MGNRYNGWVGYKDARYMPDGDLSFHGIDMYHDRSILSAGYLARSENKRLRDGMAATRSGTSKSNDFNPAFEDIIVGSNIYKNPNGDEVMLVATATTTGATSDYIWQLQFGKDPVQVFLDDATTQRIGGKLVNFSQSFDKVILMRRPLFALPILVWDGDTTSPTQFEPMTLVQPGVTQVPVNWQAEPFENRLIYYSALFNLEPTRDQIIVSDVTNFTAYDSVLGKFRINSAESDILTRVMGYYKSGLIIFMRHSIHMLSNFTQDFFQAEQRLLTRALGSVGERMPLLVGTDVIFLSEQKGFYRISTITEDRIGVPPVPISRRIQPIIDSINWGRQIIYGCSEQLGDYAFFGLCTGFLTGACDTIAVLNTTNNEWESIDTWADSNFRINALHTTFFDGQRRLFGLDYANRSIYTMYEGVADTINSIEHPVNDAIETRGYTCGDPSSFKRFERALIGIRTLSPHATVTAISDGVNEEKLLTTITKDKNKFYTFGKADYNPLVDAADAPYREDYSTTLSNAAGEDFEELPDGDIFYLPGSSFEQAVVKQQTLERFQIRQPGRWCSIRIENTSGQCDILGIQVEGIPSQETVRRVA